MMRSAAVLGLLLLLDAWCSSAVAGTTDILYDNLFNVNGSVTEGSFAIAGLNSSGFNATTGEGTLIFTFNPGAAGTYFFNAWFDNDLSAPNFNEYGASSGTAAAGQSWEIGDPTAYYNSGLPPGGLGSGVDIVDNTALNTLSSANELPGNTDNFLGNCVGSTCNGDASMAMGFAFTLAANQEEVITLNLSETAPTSGFYLQQIHPVDGCDQNGQNCANPVQLNLYLQGSAAAQGVGGGGVPEPGTWTLLFAPMAGLALWRSRNYLRTKLRTRAARRGASLPVLMLLAALLVLPQVGQAQITVLTVPWQPGTSSPHTTYNVCSDGTIPNYTTTPPSCTSPATLTESTITLGATAILPNTTDTYTGVWTFGDGTSATVTVSNASVNNYDVSTTHQYPATTASGTTWNAVLTITDTVTHVQGNATFPVIQEQDTLSSRVNVAIDMGLWFQHTSMWRGTTTINSNTVNWGGWDDYNEPCINGNVCGPYGGLDANFIQAFEVNGHFENGPASDPYSDDVARGLVRMLSFLIPESTAYEGNHTVTYNPAVLVDRCSDGTTPDFSVSPPTCATGTLIQYNPGATSCLSGSCTFVFDANNNNQIIVPGNDSGQPDYEAGMYVDALVATNNPSGIAKGGVGASGGLPGVLGLTYKDIVTDMADAIAYCQYAGDAEGGNGSSDGGGWSYYCAPGQYSYDDNSVSQWNAVGLIAAERGFNIPIPTVTKDTNQVWVTYSQETNISEGVFGGIANSGSLVGAFGYSQYAYEPWGPFAVTPSGMVQMAMDGIGRTAAGAADQRWNMAETFYHDNFCFNSATNYGPGSNGYYYDPLYYTYGMFSFSKSMLLHDPGGVLTPITYLQDEPAGTNPIDWYGDLTSAYGGTAACNGFAQTLVSRQNSDGHWGYPSFYNENSTQSLFETPWALIILKGSVFTACINNLYGKGKPNTPTSKASVTLTWSHQQNATGYAILRKSTLTGTFAQIGTSTSTVFVDNTGGLLNGHTYYYAVNPLQGSTAICESNTATVTIPRYH